MILDKNDLKQIKTIVEETVAKSENRLNGKIEDAVTKSEKKVMEAVECSEKRVVAVINREVGDLAEINRDVIQEVTKINDLEKRIIRIERKVGIAG